MSLVKAYGSRVHSFATPSIPMHAKIVPPISV